MMWIFWRIWPHSHGTDNMELVEKLPMSYWGGYEIWRCRKCRITEAL
jgi:hypothetical protein